MIYDEVIKQVDRLKNSKELEKLGAEVVKASIKRAALNRIGLRDPQVTLVIKQGDPVPEGLRNLESIKITDKGVAASDWCNSWGESFGGWHEGWGECFDPGRPASMDGGFHVRTEMMRPLQDQVFNQVLKEKFTAQEIDVLKKVKII